MSLGYRSRVFQIHFPRLRIDGSHRTISFPYIFQVADCNRSAAYR